MSFTRYIEEKKGNCISVISPVDVQLDNDNKTMVQPDVIILCNRDKLGKRVLHGAPDLAVEVLSPSTSLKDCMIKLNKYRNAGVREYWIVNPDGKQVCVHYFDSDRPAAFYTFEDNVPVGIFDNQCVVDFKKIYQEVEFLYDREE